MSYFRGNCRAGTADFDELRFYARHFSTVEVNSTFYGQPRPEVCRSWVERTPPGFQFSLKLYQKFTHPRMFKAAQAKGLDAEMPDALATPNGVDLDPDMLYAAINGMAIG